MDERIVALFVVPALVILSSFGYLFRDWSESRSRRKKFPGVPVVPARDAVHSSGEVQCVGRLVAAGGLVTAPLRAREVVFVRVFVDGKRSSYASAPSEAVTHEDTWAMLRLADDSGELRLETTVARVEFDPDLSEPRRFITNLVGPASASLADWIASRGLEARRGADGQVFTHLEIREWVLEAGDEVAVLGTFQQPDGPYREAPVMRVTRLHVLRPSKRGS